MVHNEREKRQPMEFIFSFYDFIDAVIGVEARL